MKRELKKLYNDFCNASQLLCIMGRGAEEQSAFMNVDLLKGFHHEMAYALEFVSDALKSKADTFCSLIEDMGEDDEEQFEVNDEEQIILTLYRELNENGRMQAKGFMEGLKYRC